MSCWRLSRRDRSRRGRWSDEPFMLPLDDVRWGQLTTFFGEPEKLPKVLGEWLASIGFDQEETIYRRDLFDQFLHQGTITNAAFAVVPWLVDVCKKGVTRFQVEYLTDVALVEANRLKYGVYGNRKGTAEYPEWLMPDYKQAIIESRDLADDAIEGEHDVERKHGCNEARLIRERRVGLGPVVIGQLNGYFQLPQRECFAEKWRTDIFFCPPFSVT